MNQRGRASRPSWSHAMLFLLAFALLLTSHSLLATATTATVQLSFCAVIGYSSGAAQTYDTYQISMAGVLNTTATSYVSQGAYTVSSSSSSSSSTTAAQHSILPQLDGQCARDSEANSATCCNVSLVLFFALFLWLVR